MSLAKNMLRYYQSQEFSDVVVCLQAPTDNSSSGLKEGDNEQSDASACSSDAGQQNVEIKRFPAHKLVLARSPYFKAQVITHLCPTTWTMQTALQHWKYISCGLICICSTQDLCSITCIRCKQKGVACVGPCEVGQCPDCFIVSGDCSCTARPGQLWDWSGLCVVTLTGFIPYP